MYLLSDLTVGIDFFSAPVAKPLACCVHIISRPPSEIFFSYILRLQDFDNAFKLEKICMTKSCCMKKKERKKKKNINLSSAKFFQGATKVIF